MQNIVFEEMTEFAPGNVGAVQKLVEQEGTHFQTLSDDDFKAILQSDQTHLFVARNKQSKQIVGMITLVVYRIPYRMKGILEDLVVDSAFRKQGIAEQLLQMAREFARNAGVQLLILTSSPQREAANHLYQKLGFAKRDTNVYQVLL